MGPLVFWRQPEPDGVPQQNRYQRIYEEARTPGRRRYEGRVRPAKKQKKMDKAATNMNPGAVGRCRRL